ncbi:hypothetical protein Tco_0323638 [Tanacetum coccineum]
MRTRSSLEYTIPRRRNRQRSRHQQEAIPIVDKFPIQMADDRPMAEQLQAPTGGFESAIVVPPINAQNYELNHLLLNLVHNRFFRGGIGNDEEPHAHIRHFESITNNQRYPDVLNTTIKLLLFPFSLDGESGLAYDDPSTSRPPPYVNPDNEDGKETEVTKDKVLPSTKDIQPPVNQKSHDPVKPVSSPISPELSFAQVDNSLPSKEPSKETHLPYPQRMKAFKNNMEKKMICCFISFRDVSKAAFQT